MFQEQIHGRLLKFETHPDLFSPKRVDAGTLAMLSCVEFHPGDKVLDLGCGYGAVGICAAKTVGAGQVFMTDSDPTAVMAARANAILNNVPEVTVLHSDGFQDFHETGFTRILSNPPYHADFSVPKHFILKGFNRLALGGEMWFVTKRDKWYRNKLRTVFGGVRLRELNDYSVFCAVKKSASYARRK